jgi:hypothetical protein
MRVELPVVEGTLKCLADDTTIGEIRTHVYAMCIEYRMLAARGAECDQFAIE